MAARLLHFSSSAIPLVSHTTTTTRAITRTTTTATLRPLFTNYNNNTKNSLFRLQQPQRTMASSASAKTEWLVIIPDFPNTQAKRLEVRPTHFANLEAVKNAGNLKFGGAALHDKPSDPNDPKTFDFVGSTVIYLADTKADVIEFLKQDIYAKSGVWDVDSAQIYALKTAFRIP